MYACAPPHSLSLPLSPLESALVYCKTRKTFVQSLWVYLLPMGLTTFHTLVPLKFQANRFYSKKQEAILNKDWVAHHEACSCWGTCKVMAVVTLWLNISAGVFFPCSCVEGWAPQRSQSWPIVTQMWGRRPRWSLTFDRMKDAAQWLTLFTRDRVRLWLCVSRLKLYDALSASVSFSAVSEKGFIKNTCSTDMPHKPFYLFIQNNHANKSLYCLENLEPEKILRS